MGNKNSEKRVTSVACTFSMCILFFCKEQKNINRFKLYWHANKPLNSYARCINSVFMFQYHIHISLNNQMQPNNWHALTTDIKFNVNISEIGQNIIFMMFFSLFISHFIKTKNNCSCTYFSFLHQAILHLQINVIYTGFFYFLWYSIKIPPTLFELSF